MGATPAGTRAYFDNHALSVPPVTLGKTGWQVSPVGFGGYRVSDSSPVHHAALRQALASGCNLIDTSTNYTDGGSERLAGDVLQELFKAGRLSREQVVVVSKAGYLQGSNLEMARSRAREGKPFPEVVEYGPEIWHCISPDFLEDQLTRSLNRLSLQQLDALLLHNPEYFLKAGGDHSEYYRRIQEAFRFLESEVKRGRIQYYGVSSNTFTEEREAEDFTSLAALVEIAESISPDHHFAVVQFPLNLYEPGAALEPNNEGQGVAEYAASKRIGTLVNRPLNAFVENQLLRLADFPSHSEEKVHGALKSSLERAIRLETDFPARELVPIQNIAWGHTIGRNYAASDDVAGWKQLLEWRILPTLQQAIETLVESGNDAYRTWAENYAEAAENLFEAWGRFVELNAQERSRRIADKLDSIAPDLRESRTLSQKAIRLYRSLPGIDCILVGMRRPEYVEDAMTLAPPVASHKALLALQAIASGKADS